METKKMSLANVQGKLSRAEMKKVMAGNEQDSGDGKCSVVCVNNRFTCSSDTGDCASDQYNSTICCDGTTYNCLS